MRLQKAIAHLGYCSRRKAEELITMGKVKVNGTIVSKLGFVVTNKDIITIDNYEKKENKKVAFLFNKPLGVISSSKDDRNRKTVLDFFKNEPYRLYPAGRLDINTSGLIIITNDGELANLITHPSSHLNKTYLAKIDRSLQEDDIIKLEKGIMLEDGLTSPAKIEVLKKDNLNNYVKITIHEGRNRQVRRMFNALNYNVLSLMRESIGFLKLDNLKIGAYRALNKEEIEKLKAICLAKKEKNVIPDYKKKHI